MFSISLLAMAAMGPFSALALSVGLVVVAVVVFRLPAFFALIMAGILVGFASVDVLTLTGAIGSVTREFGAAAGRLGLTIVLAAVIGGSLMESGAADRIVRTLIAWCGVRRAPLGLLLGAFLLSGPVFVDTVLLLLLPIARLLSVRTGGSAVYYLLAVGAGALLANGTIPPAPGPLIMAESLHLNLGLVLVAGAIFDVLPAAAALWASRRLGQRIPPSEETWAADTAAECPEATLPGVTASFLPVALPFVLLTLASVVALPVARAALPISLASGLKIAGDKHIALALGAFVAVVIHVRQKRLSWRQAGTVLRGPLEVAGMIILVVSAGSAYGNMIERAGLGAAVQAMADGRALNFVILGWGLAAAMRMAQGSATVAVITAIGIVAPIAAAAGTGVHPLYVFLAIGYGSKFMPWMNDVGFWLFAQWGGLTPGETIRSWSFLSSFVATVGLAEVLIASWLWPHPSW